MKNEVVRFTVDIPKSVHKQLRIMCMENDVSMRLVIEELIKAFINKDNSSCQKQ